MKLPLRIELWDDGETFDGIVDATGEYIITTDCNFYGPQREDAEFIVVACNDYENLRTEIAVLRQFGNKDCTAMADEALARLKENKV